MRHWPIWTTLLCLGIPLTAAAQPCCNLVSYDEVPCCDRPARVYGGAEFLWWYLKRDRVGPLVTTGPPESLGILGEPGVEVVYGESLISRHHRFIGVRPTLGLWLDPCHQWAVEASAVFLERDSSVFSIKPTTSFLARPYLNADGSLGAEIFAGPLPDGTVRLGGVNVYGRNEFFTQELNLLRNLTPGEESHWQTIIGFRAAQLRNRLDITATGYDEPELTTLYGVEDHFQTFNKFFGGQAGMRGLWRMGRCSVQVGSTLAIGGNEQIIRTKARRLVQTSLDDRPVGLYVLPSNTGSFQQTVFDILAEVRAELAWDVTDWLQLRVGYALIHWQNTVKSGNQIDLVNTDQILGEPFDGPARPVIPFDQESYWAQGFSIGLRVIW
jgi:hypothetical protein